MLPPALLPIESFFRRLLPLTTIAIVISFLAVTFADSDLWGHLTFGRDIVGQGWVHRHDPYSFTSDREWVNHEWLAEAVMWLSYRAAGPVGLVMLKLLLVCGAGVFVLRTWAASPLSEAQHDALLFATAVGTWPLVATIRPQVFSVALFAALMFMLKRIRDGEHGWLWIIPPLFAVWVNVHGGWIVGAGVLAIFTGCSLFDSAFSPRARAALSAAACTAAAATLVNPYGAGMLDFLWTTVGPARADIVEWQAIDRLPLIASALWMIPASLCLAALWRNGRSIPSAFMVIPIALGLSAMRVARLGGFFAIAVGIALAPAALLPSTSPPRRSPRSGSLTQIAASVLLAAAASLLFGRHIVVAGDWLPDAEAVGYVKSHQLHGKMLTWFNYGEYAIWHFSPDIQVSLDGRRETVYSTEMRTLHARIYANDPSAVADVRRLAPDYVWLPRRLAVTDRLRESGWIPLFVGDRSTILGREADESVCVAAKEGRRFFPGP